MTAPEDVNSSKKQKAGAKALCLLHLTVYGKEKKTGRTGPVFFVRKEKKWKTITE